MRKKVGDLVRLGPKLQRIIEHIELRKDFGLPDSPNDRIDWLLPHKTNYGIIVEMKKFMDTRESLSVVQWAGDPRNLQVYFTRDLTPA